MHPDEIKNILNELTKLSEYYIGVPEQENIRHSLLSNLRKIYINNPNLFSEDIKKHIDDLKQKCAKTIQKLPYKRDHSEKIRSGSVVFHLSNYYVGVIADTTKSKDIFENKNSFEEYRVFVRQDKVLIAAKENLKVLGHSRTDKCHKCGNAVQVIYCDICTVCNWFICQKCKSCGCNYKLS